MKQKKNKYDFLEINRRLNGNIKGSGWFVYKDITKNEEIKLNRKLQKRNKRKWQKEKCVIDETISCDDFKCKNCPVKDAYNIGLAEGCKSALKELVARVEKDQAERQVETINIIELKVIIKEMGVAE